MTVIDFKWDTFTFWFYAKQFAVFILFVIALLVDILICDSQINTESGQSICKIASRSTGNCVMMYFLIYEVRQIFKQCNLKEHYGNGWNIFDSLLILAYVAYTHVSFLSDEVSIKSAQVVVVFLTFVKMTYFLRIFNNFSFMI